MAPGVWMLRASGPIIIGIDLWAILFLGSQDAVFAVAEAFLLGLAVFAIWGAVQASSPALVQVEVQSNGVTFHYTSEPPQSLFWSSLRGKVKVVDWRSSGSSFSRFPFTLEFKHQGHGISQQAGTQIVQAARERGLFVKEVRRGTPGGQIQSWLITPLLSRPLSEG